jgi:ribulose-bisphosphate carboxylase large chain
MRHRGDYTWKGVKSVKYKHEGAEGHWACVARHILMGGLGGERAKFHVRYFEIAPGGFSSCEAHGHEHFVVVMRGKGKVRLGRKKEEIGYLDCVYVAPDRPHQFLNPYDEPFGFLCMVDAERDRPRVKGAGKSFCELP